MSNEGEGSRGERLPPLCVDVPHISLMEWTNVDGTPGSTPTCTPGSTPACTPDSTPASTPASTPTSTVVPTSFTKPNAKKRSMV